MYILNILGWAVNNFKDLISTAHVLELGGLIHFILCSSMHK